MRNIIPILLLALILNSCVTSKINKKSVITSGKIVFKKYKDGSTIDNKEIVEKMEALLGKSMDSIIPIHKAKEDSIFKKKFSDRGMEKLFIDSMKDTTFIHLEIYKDTYYRLDSTKGNNELYSIIGSKALNSTHNNTTRIHRNSLAYCTRNKDKKCKPMRSLKYMDESNMDITYIKKETKTILGYNCIKIEVKIKNTLFFEAYATDEIPLNYNPIGYRIKSIIDKGYFILETKQKRHFGPVEINTASEITLN